MTEYYKNKKINKTKLLNFGFKKKNDTFIYNQPILDEQFNLTILVDTQGNVHTKLVETATNELYILHLVEDACGDFVGKVKKEYNDILERLYKECFEPDVFKTKQAQKLIEYIKERYSNELEFLWEKFANNAIVRRKDNLKWYAAFLTVSKEKLGFEDKTLAEIIDLRAENVDKIIDNKQIFPGYHMNKKHWITIILDGSVPLETIKTKIDESYELARNRKRGK